MFGMGGSEIIVILIVALLFLGPDKLPGAAKSISKGIRDLKKQSRSLQQQIESDEQIGGAIRDLKSALRGEELPVTPTRKLRPRPVDNTIHQPPTEALPAGDAPPTEADKPTLTLPATAGEPDADSEPAAADDKLAELVKPASGTVAKG